MSQPSSPEPDLSSFGPNEWLVDELYQQYLADKKAVDPAWWDFFADYQPADVVQGRRASGGAAEGADAPGTGGG